MIGRIPITDVAPQVNCRRWPAKAVVGETVTVSATVFREGHDAVGANVVAIDPHGRRRGWTPMTQAVPGTDRWVAQITPDLTGRWVYYVEAWGDPVATWRAVATVKVPAGVDVELTFTEGALLLERAAQSPNRPAEERAVLTDAATALRDQTRPAPARLAAADSPDVLAALAARPLRELVTASERLSVQVDRVRALAGAWYEFFPRSEGARLDPEAGLMRQGTFRTAAQRLPAIADMGFDVVYLPPIHPVGEVGRKGRNNTLPAEPGDVGSPWAIGSRFGGHDAVDPGLGTLEDFDFFVARAGELGLEVALDLALQCAPDHPWVREHPEWFTHLPDGSIAYAENPPKKYQDIYPLNFDNDPKGLALEVLRIVRHWMSHGVRIFRVDNPHTKPVPFWEWLLGEVRATDPDVIFLAEAFTRPAMLHTLAKVGFHQSYTYFTWRATKQELESYLSELAHETSDFLRPNLFVNTPDILHAYLQYGGPPAFAVRATLAATGAPSWGMYSGFELFEHVALRPGSEEYLDSEKYQLRPRDWAAAEREGRTLTPYVRLLNDIRRRHPSLRQLRDLTVHGSDGDAFVCFSKRHRGTDGTDEDQVVVVVNLDPHAAQETIVHLDMPALGLDWDTPFEAYDEVSGQTFVWSTHNYVRLDPFTAPAHILHVRKAP